MMQFVVREHDARAVMASQGGMPVLLQPLLSIRHGLVTERTAPRTGLQNVRPRRPALVLT